MLKLRLVETPDAAGDMVADIIHHLVASKPDAVLGLATGSSPSGIWRALARRHVDFSRTRAFALDEYVGLPPGHRESYRAVIDEEIVRPLGLDPARVHVPDPNRQDASAAYELAIAEAGGVDLQILGIGRTGHIGFNEPGSPLDSRTRVVSLDGATRADNARFFGSIDEMPRFAITQGVGTILEARRIVMLAFGSGKAPALAAALEGPVTSEVPASALQRHRNVLVLADHSAASRLRSP